MNNKCDNCGFELGSNDYQYCPLCGNKIRHDSAVTPLAPVKQPNRSLILLIVIGVVILLLAFALSERSEKERKDREEALIESVTTRVAAEISDALSDAEVIAEKPDASLLEDETDKEQPVENMEIPREPEPAAENAILYETAYYTVEIPKSWEGKYFVKDDAYGLRFYNTANADANCGGFLFGIAQTTVEKYNELKEYDSSNRGLIHQSGNIVYYLAEPSDVQFDISDPILLDEYSSMEADEDTILKSIQFK